MTKNKPNKEIYLTTKEMAEELGIHDSTMRRYVRKYELPAIRMGHQIVRLHAPTVRRLLEQKKRR